MPSPTTASRGARTGDVAAGLQSNEYALCRPLRPPDAGGYEMWYCGRGPAYRLGCAESPDGKHWTRCPDRVGIDVSAAGWDAEMLAYPCVFEHRGNTYLLYNGNAYGRDGFGLAVAN